MKWLKIQSRIIYFYVNLNFFPEYFLGLVGIPLLYSDYPDAWKVISFGSITQTLETVLLHYSIGAFIINEYRLNLKKIKSVAYSSQGSHTGQLDFCNWLADSITTG